MVEVFKTNIERSEEAERIIRLLQGRFPNCQINMDLEDCDKILRIKGQVHPSAIINLVESNHYRCEVLQ